MKKLSAVLLLTVLFTACKGKEEKYPETALDTGREFIRASLNGSFDKASSLLLADSQNIQLFDSYKVSYNNFSAEKKKGYREASYEINKYLDVDDSTTVINYSNSFMNKPMDIKVVRRAKTWKVDFKYTFSGNLPID